MSNYSFAQLQAIWIQAGGSPLYSSMAAAIALAESGGNPNNSNNNSNGTTDRGLWQINSIHGSQSTFDPLANAKSAVAISKNGTNWRPWCTAWSDGRCGGTFMGSGSPVLKHLPAGASTGGTPASGSDGTVAQPAGISVPMDPLGGAQALKNGITNVTDIPSAITGVWNAFSTDVWFGLIFAIGFFCLLGGLIILAMQLKPVQAGVKLATKL